jgi:sterol desaturase/sphingolipid hydroxylase (fatty acid hydroxylase superfamily)
MGKRKIIRALLILIFAWLVQHIWMSELNGVVWKISYIGERAAFLVAAPNYDSAMSVRIFSAVAIVVNFLVYVAVLWSIHMLIDRWKQRRAERRAAMPGRQG